MYWSNFLLWSKTKKHTKTKEHQTNRGWLQRWNVVGTCSGSSLAESTTYVMEQGNVSPVVLLLGQEWCWVGRVWRTVGFITLLLDGDWDWVSIFLVSSVFLITATWSEETGPLTKAETSTDMLNRSKRWSVLWLKSRFCLICWHKYSNFQISCQS